MKVVILAAGYAVRLRPLTLTMSKSLLPIAKKKIIDRILDKIDALKRPVDSVSIVTNAKFFDTFNDWLQKSKYKNKVSLINDGTTTNETRLGAIRDMEMVIEAEKISDDMLVVAGDNLFDFDLNKFISFAEVHDGVSIACYDIRSLDNAKNYGVVRIDPDNKVVDFKEKPEKPDSTLISTGIYYFPKKKIKLIEEYVKMQDKLDAPGYYIGWLSGADKVYGFSFLEDFYDIENIESYNKADREYSEKEKKKNG